MGVAALLFGLLVGIFHFGGSEANGEQYARLSDEPPQPERYEESTPLQDHRDLNAVAVDEGAGSQSTLAAKTKYTDLASADNIEQLAQTVADLVAAKPDSASSVVTIALAQVYDESTLGDVALIAATATKAAPTQAPAIAGSVARALRDQSDPALAAAIASIITLVPEQSRDVGLVVGAVVGDDTDALGMVAQTVAIAVGEETFSSLSEGSGVSIAVLMKESSRLGVAVPFDVPNYAAQLAPSASMVADSSDDPNASEGEM